MSLRISDLSAYGNIVLGGTIDTGQGATEVHLMNQNLRTTDSVVYNTITLGTAGNTRSLLNANGDFLSYYSTEAYTRVSLGRDIAVSGGAGIAFGGTSYALFGTNNTTGTNLYWKLATTQGSITTSPNMTLTSTGLGIYQTSPVARLDVRGGSDGDQMINIGSPSVSGILNSPANIYINADSDNDSASGVIALGFNRTGFTGGTEVLRILESNSRVAIGKTSAGYTLDVAGTSNFDSWSRGFTGYLDQNMLDTTTWYTAMGSNMVGNWSPNGAGNSIVYGTDNFGRKAITVTGTSNGTNGANSGWNYNNIPIDFRKAYRLVVFIRVANNSAGYVYLGCDGNSLNLNGTSNTNPYFHVLTRSSLVANRWYMLVGYIHAFGDLDTTNYSAVYDCSTGQVISTGTDYRNGNGTTTQTHRCYDYYDTTNGGLQYYHNPRFEEINGKEPSIEALLGRDASSTTSTNAFFNGFVGINTPTPNTWLSIQSSTGNASNGFGGNTDDIGMLQVYATGANTAGASVTVRNYYGTGQLFQWVNSGMRIGNRIITNGGTGHVYLTSGNDSIFLTGLASGVVGIGNTSPALSTGAVGLHVTNNSYIQMRLSSTNGSGGLEWAPSSGHVWEAQANTSSQWFIYNRNQSLYRFLIDSNGFVGFNTQSPVGGLDVRAPHSSPYGAINVYPQSTAWSEGIVINPATVGGVAAVFYRTTANS